MTTVEVGEARQVWCAVAAKSTALYAVGGLDTAKVGGLTSTTKTASVAVRSAHNGTAGCWDATIVEGVADWYTRLALTADALIETTIDYGSSCVSSVVDGLAVCTATLGVADLSLTGWLELNRLCWVTCTRHLARVVIYRP